MDATSPPSSSVRVFSGAIAGIDAIPVEVEVDSTPGLHFFTIVGLPDKSVEESKDRIASAMKNSGFIAPNQKNRRIIVNLAPADIKKEGSAYDLSIALGYLLTTQQITFDTQTSKRLLLGELALDGSMRPISSILPLALMARDQGFAEIIVPKGNAQEASVVDGLRVLGCDHLRQVTDYLENKATIEPTPSLKYSDLTTHETRNLVDIAHVQGQESAKRALIVAAAGAHNILFYGPPGSGKSMLAQALAGILPPMSQSEALEVTKIYSICGLLGNQPIMRTRSFRQPHHTTSAVAIIGGGAWPKPGEISLAHHGVLFLDELPEFQRDVIEALRQPLESGEVIISRAAGSCRFPARFMLVAAMNPCPCGNYGNEYATCLCTPQAIHRYQRKISGPLLDRIDLQVIVARQSYDKLTSTSKNLTSREIMNTLSDVREVQRQRFQGVIATNSAMTSQHIKKYCRLSNDAEELLKTAVDSHALSARGYHKILKIARTIADLDHADIISTPHIAEAISYRIKTDDQT